MGCVVTFALGVSHMDREHLACTGGVQDAYDGVEGEGVRGACAVSSPLLSTSRTVQASQWRDLMGMEMGNHGVGAMDCTLGENPARFLQASHDQGEIPTPCQMTSSHSQGGTPLVVAFHNQAGEHPFHFSLPLSVQGEFPAPHQPSHHHWGESPSPH